MSPRVIASANARTGSSFRLAATRALDAGFLDDPAPELRLWPLAGFAVDDHVHELVEERDEPGQRGRVVERVLVDPGQVGAGAGAQLEGQVARLALVRTPRSPGARAGVGAQVVVQDDGDPAVTRRSFCGR